MSASQSPRQVIIRRGPWIWRLRPELPGKGKTYVPVCSCRSCGLTIVGLTIDVKRIPPCTLLFGPGKEG